MIGGIKDKLAKIEGSLKAKSEAIFYYFSAEFIRKEGESACVVEREGGDHFGSYRRYGEHLESEEGGCFM